MSFNSHTNSTHTYTSILTTSAKFIFVLLQLMLLQPHFDIVSLRWCAKIEIFPHRYDQFCQRNGKNQTQYKCQWYFHPSNNHSRVRVHACTPCIYTSTQYFRTNARAHRHDFRTFDKYDLWISLSLSSFCLSLVSFGFNLPLFSHHLTRTHTRRHTTNGSTFDAREA